MCSGICTTETQVFQLKSLHFLLFQVFNLKFFTKSLTLQQCLDPNPNPNPNFFRIRIQPKYSDSFGFCLKLCSQMDFFVPILTYLILKTFSAYLLRQIKSSYRFSIFKNRFCKVFAKIYFCFCENFFTKIDENGGDFRENLCKNAKSVIFTTYFNFLRTFFSIILFKMPTLVNSIQSDAPFPIRGSRFLDFLDFQFLTVCN
jgi:hypothetical protein